MKKFVRKFKFNSKFDNGRSEFFQPSPVTDVCITELPDGCRKFQSDIFLLFNQQRLAKVLGNDTLQSWLGSINVRDTGIDTSKFTDDQLMSFIKSRHIQSPAELRAWSEFLNESANEVIREYDTIVAAEKQRQMELINQKQVDNGVRSSGNAAAPTA